MAGPFGYWVWERYAAMVSKPVLSEAEGSNHEQHPE